MAEGVSEREWRDVWAAHLGLVRLVDDCVGRLLLALEENGHGDNTVVVFTADHGDHLGAHCLYQKMEMYEEAIRIPFIIRTPGASGGEHEGLVSHLDLMPTALELAGLAAPADLPGRSLRDVLHGGAGPRREAVFLSYDGNFRSHDIRRAVVGVRFKYIWHRAGGEELSDLERDPRELVNLSADPSFAGDKAHLRALGRRWAETTGDQLRWPGETR